MSEVTMASLCKNPLLGEGSLSRFKEGPSATAGPTETPAEVQALVNLSGCSRYVHCARSYVARKFGMRVMVFLYHQRRSRYF